MRRAAAILAAALALGVAASPAGAANTPGSAPRDPNALISPKTEDRPPAGYRRSANQVIAIARRVPKIADVLRRHPGYTRDAYLKGANRWQVSFFEKSEPGETRKEIGQVLIWDPTGQVLEAWTGFQVPWSMARGYPGAFGRKANALYLWLPLSLLFLVPFVTPRRPFRLLHLDLLVLLGFSVSLAYFNDGNIGVSVPAAYPPLVYLLVRMLFAARPRRGPPDVVRLLVPASWLAIALVFLLGFRWALNLSNSNVIDVGYAGVIGADRLMDGKQPLRRLPPRQPARRHLRPRELLRLRPLRAGVPLERPLGRPARGPRGGDLLRRAHRAAAVAARPADPGPHPGDRARLRVGRLPLHPVHAELEQQRLARGGARRGHAASWRTGRWPGGRPRRWPG